MSQTAQRYKSLQYLLHTPSGAGAEDTRRKHPVILFLHGAGERGNDPGILKGYCLPKVVEEQPDFPFIVISPQCPTGQWWVYDPPLLMSLLDYVVRHYFGDDRRIYLTGASMGGYGAWMLGTLYPQHFAAIVPVSAPALEKTADVCALRNTPIWAWHGSADMTVPPEQTESMIEALRACGGTPEVTYVAGADHELTTAVYEQTELYSWLRMHTLRP
jgi:predicted peptidase